MITKQIGYKASDDSMHPTMEAARMRELQIIAKEYLPLSPLTDAETNELPGRLVDFVLTNRAKILDILTTTERSRARARAINGAKRVRKPKTPPSPELELGTAAAAQP